MLLYMKLQSISIEQLVEQIHKTDATIYVRVLFFTFILCLILSSSPYHFTLIFHTINFLYTYTYVVLAINNA